MTETVPSNVRIFDVACPNPLKLKEISCLAVVAELWRRKISSGLPNCGPGTAYKYKLIDRTIVLEEALPNMSRWIYDYLNKYITKCGRSILEWLREQNLKVFHCHFIDGWHEILSAFHDFALDWNGTVHRVRSAKRMLLCDQVGIGEKFRLACLFCFEDDIRRIWPSVSSTIVLKKFNFQYHPEFYYWTCLLRNELHKIPNPYNRSIDEIMLYECGSSKNYSYAQYFWNRIPLQRQSLEFISNAHDNDPNVFARFILPKLNEQQLVEFLAERGGILIRTQLIDNERKDRDLVLPIWMYIRNKIDKLIFGALIGDLLWEEAYYFERSKRHKYHSEVSLCCELWNNAAQSLKQYVFDNVLLQGRWFSMMRYPTARRKETRFLMRVLSDASFEERSVFWSKLWRSLILGVYVEDLLVIMKLCFRNQEEIAMFKESTLFKYENIRPYLAFMVDGGYPSPDFSEVNRYLYFCNSDAQKVMELKQRFLHDPNNGVSELFALSKNEEWTNEFLKDIV